ncbi:MAG: hypothetical protein M3154_01470, partial [Candidatus Eremiobacteraeota bacterium]|nr:hypothetical protein [Candidatus Eremiobacteraeota bacterium]
MPDLSGLPYDEIAFDRTATLVDPGQVDATAAALASAAGHSADLVVLSHGWNDTADEARALYAAFGANFAVALAANGVLPARRVQVLGILWPSKRFADARLTPAEPAHALITTQLTRVESLAGADLSDARAQVPRLTRSVAAQRTFIDHVLATLPPTATQEEAQPAHLVQMAGDPHFLDRLGSPVLGSASPGGTPLTAHALQAEALRMPAVATGIGDWFSAIDAGALNLLNYATYYLMKDRAGHIGRNGLAPVLARLRAAAPNTRVHLVGHSFG